MMLQVLSTILRDRRVGDEAAKTRSFTMQQQDIANAQARAMEELRKTNNIAISQASITAQKDAQVALTKALAPDAKIVAQEAYKRDVQKSIISMYGADVGDYNDKGELIGVLPAAVRRSTLHDSDIHDSEQVKKRVIDKEGGFVVDPARQSIIAERNPYYSETNNPMEVYEKVATRLRTGKASQSDINLIPYGSRSRYEKEGFDAWFTNRTNRDLIASIEKQVGSGAINTGYNPKYATAEDMKQMAPTYRWDQREELPQDWFDKQTNKKGIFRTNAGGLWIDGEYVGKGDIMDKFVRNPKIPSTVGIKINADGSGGSYITLQENIAAASAGLKSRSALYAAQTKLNIDTQVTSEREKYRWFNERAYMIDESETGGLDENELLDEAHSQVYGIDTEDNSVPKPYAPVYQQYTQAKALWNTPETGEMHEYRKKVIQNLSALIRRINRDADQKNKDKYYDPEKNKNWKDYAVSDPEGKYSSDLEKSTWVNWMDFGGGSFQNYKGISTYDEYVSFLKELIDMQEELMIQPQTNYGPQIRDPYLGY